MSQKVARWTVGMEENNSKRHYPLFAMELRGHCCLGEMPEPLRSESTLEL